MYVNTRSMQLWKVSQWYGIQLEWKLKLNNYAPFDNIILLNTRTIESRHSEEYCVPCNLEAVSHFGLEGSHNFYQSDFSFVANAYSNYSANRLL